MMFQSMKLSNFIMNIIEMSLSEPHGYRYCEKSLFLCMYVCVAMIHCPPVVLVHVRLNLHMPILTLSMLTIISIWK